MSAGRRPCGHRGDWALSPITVVPPSVFVRKQLQLLGSYGGSLATLQRVLQLVGSGRLDLSRSITHCFSLDDADAALRTVHEKIGDPQRVVVTPE